MSTVSRLRCMFLVAALLLSARTAAAQTAATPNSCRTCHASLAEARLATPADVFSQQDIHRESGFGCVDCHGGDATAADKARAHDAARGFKGAPAGQAQIATCARCHSDAELMRRFSPRPARRSGGRVRHQRARQATGGRRHAGGDVRELPRRTRHPARERREVAGVPDQRRHHVRGVSCQPDAYGPLHAAQRLTAADQPARGLSAERPLRRADEGQRSLGADVQRLPRQPRRGAPRASGRSPTCAARATRSSPRSSRRASTRRSSTRAAWSATATTPC